MIRAQHLGAIAERPQVVKKQEVKAEKLILCKQCNLRKPPYRVDTCAACCRYEKRNGHPRTISLIRLDAKRQSKAKWCKNCGNPSLYVGHLCLACYKYQVKHGKNRERWRWDEDFKCSVCGFPKKAGRRRLDGAVYFTRDKCRTCYDYERRYKKPRPAHLWGAGKHGFCDCGYPAEHQKDGFNLCNRCVKEYR
jgi:hypothetical protein